MFKNTMQFGLISSIAAMSLLAGTPALASDVPGAVNDHVPLGTAYNSISGKFLNFQTVQGRVVEAGSTESDVNVAQNMSYRQISSQLDADIDINADFPVVQAEAGADIAMATASDEFSSNWVLTVVNSARSQVMGPIGQNAGVTLSPQGQMIADAYVNGSMSDAQLLRAAGDEFVSEIEYASYLFVAMKADYLSAQDKTDIEGRIAVNFALGEVEGDLGFLTEEQRASVTITVRAHQFGGDPLGLTEIVPNNIIQCNLVNFDPCAELFARAIQYAQGAGEFDGRGFVNQNEEITNANVVGYKTQRYEDVALTLDLAPLDGFQPADNDRIIGDLESEYIDQLGNRQRAAALLGQASAYLESEQRNQLRHIARIALDNAAAMRDLINYCRANAFNDDCQDYVDANCQQSGGSWACLDQYSTNAFDISVPEENVCNEDIDHRDVVNYRRDDLSSVEADIIEEKLANDYGDYDHTCSIPAGSCNSHTDCGGGLFCSVYGWCHGRNLLCSRSWYLPAGEREMICN